MTNKDLIMELVNNLEVESKNAEIIAKILDCDIDGKIADVVEVVRCKDCIHAEVGKKDVWCELHESYKNIDGFCDEGERKEAE